MQELFHDVPTPRFPFAFRQFRAGPHENFHYVMGEPDGEAAIVDPAFALDQVFAAARGDGLRVSMAFLTHGHWDHIGGIPAISAFGVEQLVAHRALDGHEKIQDARNAGMDIRFVKDGDVMHVGDVPVLVLHTPGHQPESTCYLVGRPDGPQALLGGDCLFIDSCGRTDFPGGDTDAMHASMAKVRGLLDDPRVGRDVHLMPGHDYADRPHERLDVQVERNPALATAARDAFDALPFLRG